MTYSQNAGRLSAYDLQQSTDAQATTSCDTLTRHLLRLQSLYARAYIHRNSHSCCHLSIAQTCGGDALLHPGKSQTISYNSRSLEEHQRPVVQHQSSGMKKTTYARMRCASLFMNHTHKCPSANTFNYLRIYFMIYDTAVESLRHRGGVITLPR